MKTLRHHLHGALLQFALFLLVLLPLFTAAGCSSTASGSVPMPILQKTLDTALPPAFTGYAKAEHVNPYFTLSLEADGLKRTDQGWTWTWLAYHRQSHFPLTPGLAWGSTGDVILGAPPTRSAPPALPAPSAPPTH